MSRLRHTMGQDWGGRRKMNPENCPVITRHDVLQEAERRGVKVRRGDYFADGTFYSSNWGTWWREASPGVWLTLGATNYLAFCALNQMTNNEEG